MDRRGQAPGLAPRHDASSRIQKPESAADKLAALKSRVAAAVGGSKAKGGLNVGLHPALEDLGTWKPPSQTNKSSSSRNHADPSRAPFATGKPQSNPYFDEQATQSASSKQRQSRQLVFNQKGKYIQQGNALRRQAALEAMKRRIAAQTRKAGIDQELDLEKNLVVEAPPLIEWWDEGLLDGTYDQLSDALRHKITTADSIITEFVQHPVALEPPQDRKAPVAKPMYLTSKEQAKLRRQRRMAELKEQQAKIRLGLVPAPPPKVKKSNMMRVYAEAAVKDPTAVEAMVNRQIAERQEKHFQSNEERKLSKEDKHEKLAANQQKDAEKGIHMVVFKIKSLANGQHRFKLGKNAEQHGLTGVCILHPQFNLVIAEGGEHSIRKYKQLMLNRIDWTENVPSRDRAGRDLVVRDWLSAENEQGNLKDMSANTCQLVFEGEEKTRAFRKWGSKVCELESEAKDFLSRSKTENFWTIAKGI
jgi:U4/U6 small nuclear ribonucleoprotein PRP3